MGHGPEAALSELAYTIAIDPDAALALTRIPNPYRTLIKTHVDRLGANPRPPKSLPLTHDPRRRWRIQVGRHYRVLYVIDDARRLVTVLDVARRAKDTYDNG